MSAISISDFKAAIDRRGSSLVLDVRRNLAFRDSTETIAGALRRDPATVADWVKTLPRASNVVVYCVHGHEVSQNVTKALAESGLQARYLEAGIEHWKAEGGALDRKPKA